jgi:hypothetical protein
MAAKKTKRSGPFKKDSIFSAEGQRRLKEKERKGVERSKRIKASESKRKKK